MHDAMASATVAPIDPHIAARSCRHKSFIAPSQKSLTPVSFHNIQISAFLTPTLRDSALPPEVHSNSLMVPMFGSHLDDGRPRVHNMGFQNMSGRV